MKSVKMCGRPFCWFWAPHRGQVSPGTDGGTALVGNHVCHHLPSVPLQHWWLTLRQGHCAGSMALPNVPTRGQGHSLVPKPCLVLIPAQTGSAERPQDRGHLRGAGKRGDTSRMVSKVTSNHSHCPYLTLFLKKIFFCLFCGKYQKLNIVPWSVKDISESTEEPLPHVGLIKQEKRDLKQNFGSDHPNLWQGLET